MIITHKSEWKENFGLCHVVACMTSLDEQNVK